jgi:hypothetical protein
VHVDDSTVVDPPDSTPSQNKKVQQPPRLLPSFFRLPQMGETSIFR